MEGENRLKLSSDSYRFRAVARDPPAPDEMMQKIKIQDLFGEAGLLQIPKSRRLRQDVHELKASLSCVVRPCLKRQEREKEKGKRSIPSAEPWPLRGLKPFTNQIHSVHILCTEHRGLTHTHAQFQSLLCQLQTVDSESR